MSAEVLRQAAALMRERAEAATQPVQSSGWIVGRSDREFERDVEVYTGPECRGSRDITTTHFAADAKHIASWHPAVALAVADWLDAVADRHSEILSNFASGSQPGLITANENVTAYEQAVAVAVAYLGSAS